MTIDKTIPIGESLLYERMEIDVKPVKTKLADEKN